MLVSKKEETVQSLPFLIRGVMYNKVGYHLADHCNLNCAGCNHFSPLTKEKYADLTLLEKNIQRLMEVLDISEFNFVGGEPLLHPDVISAIKIVRKYYDGILNITTNGILLKKFNKAVFNEYNVNVIVSDYHLFDGTCSTLDKEFFKYNYISDIHNMKQSKCPFFVDTFPMLLFENGDLHRCCVSANIDSYNTFYGKSLNLIEGDDYINIYNSSRYDILKLIVRKKHNFCGYCREGTHLRWKLHTNDNMWECKL